MTFGANRVLVGIIAVLAGILVLVFPDLVRWIIGIFLIVWGFLVLLGRR